MPHITLTEDYRPRRFTDLGTLEHDGWMLKITGIAYHSAEPRPELVEASLVVARDVLPRPAVSDDRYGIGYLGIHDGRGACFTFVDWWEAENELHHHTFTAPWDEPAGLEDVTGHGFVACAWDLALISHERQAWVTHVLANPNGPDLDAYLAQRLVGPA